MDISEWSLSSQGRVLCQHYIIHRSLKAGAQIKKVRMLFHNLSEGQGLDDLAERLLEIIHIMERLNPGIYDSCSSKLKLTMSTDEQVKWTYGKITSELLKTGVNWGKLISIFTVCGTLASDCVSQGHTDFLPIILDCFEESCSQPNLHHYLKSANGWKGVVDHYDNLSNGQRASGKDRVANVANKSIRLVQSLSKRIDMVSAAMLCFFLFLMTISISQHFTRVTRI